MTSPGLSLRELDEIEKPSAQLSIIFANKDKSSLPGLEKFKNLVKDIQIALDISGNRLDCPVRELLSLKLLRKLNLSNNNITNLWDLPHSIEQLNISQNSLRTLEIVLPGLILLQVLDISHNCLSSLSGLSVLPHLKYLYVQNNRIASLVDIERIRPLQELDLEGNLIAISQVECLTNATELCAVNLKNNPIIKELRNNSLQISGFKEIHESIFVRDLEKLKEMPMSRLKNLVKKGKEKHRRLKPYSSRNTSMQEVYDQVIDENPEMEESLNSSESEERFEYNKELVKKPSHSIAKLQLEKITEKTIGKISCEKWSTNPGSTTETLFDDIIEYYKIEEGTGSCDKYEYVVNVLKQREDQRLELIKMCAELEKKVENRETEADLKGKLEKVQWENAKLIEDLVKIRESSLELREEYELCIAQLNQCRERARELEEEAKSSSRLNFSCSFDSESPFFNSESTEVYSRLLNSEEIIVAKPIGDYIQRLLQKISKLASKAKRLRLEREKFKHLFEYAREKHNLKDLNG